MRRFFDVFQFEVVPAADQRADARYLVEVDRCDLYVGLFGDEYGFEDADGVSPTQREFARATVRHTPRLVFVKGANEDTKHQSLTLELRILTLLANGPLSKALISAALGQREISGQLNKIIRLLLADRTIEYTLPQRPTSRLQMYRLTAKGQAFLQAPNR